VGSRIEVISAEESPDRLKQLAQDRPAWIVEGGWHANPAIQESLTSLCEVWASETSSQFESLRVRFSPTCEVFLRSRVTPNDAALLQRWFVVERGSRLEMTDHDARFLLEGWSGPEHDPTGPTFRWVDGRRATVMLPISDARGEIRFRARALGYPNAPPQQLVALVNGRRALAASLSDGWSEHRIASDAVRPGLNELTFEFSRATRPADIDPAAVDRRELSAAFDFIEVADAPR
ncbi:MAG TPA: hypothetical protein VIL97_09340, partial [Thermoanaerobaculia bacterium]